MAGTRRWKTLLPTVTLTAVGFTMTESSAYALFPPIWPGVSPPAVIVPPAVNPPVVVVPPVLPPPFTPPLVVVPPAITPPVVVPPSTPNHHCNCDCITPEPSSLVAGMTGLVTAAGWAARRRKKS